MPPLRNPLRRSAADAAGAAGAAVATVASVACAVDENACSPLAGFPFVVVPFRCVLRFNNARVRVSAEQT